MKAQSGCRSVCLTPVIVFLVTQFFLGVLMPTRDSDNRASNSSYNRKG